MKAKLTDNIPNYPLSASMQRLYNQWPAPTDHLNEFFTNFKYSRISGLGKSKYVSRRDPSKIIRANGKYYVWYTKRKLGKQPVGMDHSNETLPAVDWDLADIWYAISTDGFDWEEQGIAIHRSEKLSYGDRSLSTPDILVFKGKYYLFYQAFTGPFSNNKGDQCDVSMAWADSPDGPWTKINKSILPLGQIDEWDGGAIHDPNPLVFKGKIWLFFKGQPQQKGPEYLVRAQGVAIADQPEGPYVKHELNPLLNSGHETCLFPYKEGIAALLLFDGLEKNTVQYASDGIDYQIKSQIICPPIAPGPFCEDAFTDSGDGQGISWGLCHLQESHIDPNNPRRIVEFNSFLIRFDCDLHRQFNRPYFRNPRDQIGRFDESTYFQSKMILEKHVKEDIIKNQSRYYG